jgi:hypothetical protein
MQNIIFKELFEINTSIKIMTKRILLADALAGRI